MANNGVGKFKAKPTIAVEQAVNGAGAKPNAAASMHAQGTGGRKDPDPRNTVRQPQHSAPAPDHRVAKAHTQPKDGSSAVINEASR